MTKAMLLRTVSPMALRVGMTEYAKAGVVEAELHALWAWEERNKKRSKHG